jgi:hypothetical protein
MIDKRVRFAPNPRWPMRTVEARVQAHRADPRHRDPKARGEGWLDTVDDAGTERSVRPSRCEIVK